MELNKIWNESNEITMKEHIDEKSIDVILTSPFYNSTVRIKLIKNYIKKKSELRNLNIMKEDVVYEKRN